MTTSNKRRVQTKVEEFDQLKIYSDILDKIGAGCGFCATLDDFSVHAGDDCPRMTSHQRNQFKHLQAKIHYEKTLRSKPCFTCHICSFGQDKLHPPFVRGDKTLCPNPNLVLPLIVAIQSNAHISALVSIHLKATRQWTNMDDFISWFSTMNPVHKTQSMAIIAWYSEYKAAGKM